jgi:hypothetical protein
LKAGIDLALERSKVCGWTWRLVPELQAHLVFKLTDSSAAPRFAMQQHMDTTIAVARAVGGALPDSFNEMGVSGASER